MINLSFLALSCTPSLMLCEFLYLFISILLGNSLFISELGKVSVWEFFIFSFVVKFSTSSYRFYVLPNLDGHRVCVLVYLLFYLLYYNDLVISSVSTYSYFFILLILIHYSLFISANRKALLKEFLNLVLIPILEHSYDRLREKNYFSPNLLPGISSGLIR